MSPNRVQDPARCGSGWLPLVCVQQGLVAAMPVSLGFAEAAGLPLAGLTALILKPGGMVVSIAGVPEPLTARKDLAAPGWVAALFWAISLPVRLRARRARVGYRYLFMHPSADDLRFLAALVDEGALQPVIDSVYPFAGIADAFAALERGHAKGKIVVTLPAAPR